MPKSGEMIAWTAIAVLEISLEILAIGPLGAAVQSIVMAPFATILSNGARRREHGIRAEPRDERRSLLS
jgi:hypothetical protein